MTDIAPYAPTDEGGDVYRLARPTVTFGQTGSAADAPEPSPWGWLPGVLFGAAAFAALVAAIALVVTWPTHGVRTVPVGTPGTTAPQATTPADVAPEAPQVAPPVQTVIQQVPAARPQPPAQRAPGGGVPPIHSPVPAPTTPVVITPVVTTPVVTPQPKEGSCTPPECITVTQCTPSNCVVDPAGVGPAPGGGGATRNSGGTGEPDPIRGTDPASGGSGVRDGVAENCPADLPPELIC